MHVFYQPRAGSLVRMELRAWDLTCVNVHPDSPVNSVRRPRVFCPVYTAGCVLDPIGVRVRWALPETGALNVSRTSLLME